jgi:phosphoribosylamine--glycine ligase
MGGVEMKDGELVTTHPWVMCVTGVGGTVFAARYRAYSNAEKVSFQDMIYREDIGARWEYESVGLFHKGLIHKKLLKVY